MISAFSIYSNTHSYSNESWKKIAWGSSEILDFGQMGACGCGREATTMPEHDDQPITITITNNIINYSKTLIWWLTNNNNKLSY